MVDPTTLAVVRGYLEEVVDEMDVVHVRSAFSPIVAEMKDRANGIFSAPQGDTVAQGQFGSPIFISTMQYAVKGVLGALSERGKLLRPGDIWMVNDPFSGGTHLQDVKLVRGFFWDDELVMILGNTGHWLDIGSAQAGAFGPAARSLHEEGVIYPPMRVVVDGEIDPDVLALIRANNRLPDLQEGDLRGQINALLVGERRLRELLERYGPETIKASIAELDERSERQMRDRLSEMDDGRYEAEDWLDNDGVVDEPLRIAIAIAIEGDSMTIDFTGTDPGPRGPFNITLSTTITACHIGLKHLFPEIPINAGCFRPIVIRAPEGTLLNAAYGKPVGGYIEPTTRIVGMVGRALAEVVPERVTGTTFETGGTAVLSGTREDGTPFVTALPYGGGYGGYKGGDGIVNGTSPAGMATFPALESIESGFPLVWEGFGIREGSGGAGEWMGGCGNYYRIRLEAPATLSVLGDRALFPPLGVLGGEPGAPNQVRFTVDGEWRTPAMHAKEAAIDLQPGDLIELASPGGGGYGDPGNRNPELVERDRRAGLLGDKEPGR